MSATKMAAVVVAKPGCYQVREVPRPTPKPDEVLVRVLHSAVCGSDLRLIKGVMEDIAFPLIPGHEWSGEVVEAPRRFQHLIGQHVVSDILQSCKQCANCIRGYSNLCRKLVEPGISTNGGFAEYVAVRGEYVHALPPTLPVSLACMVEPLAVVLYALRLLPLEGGECVLIFGGGGIGQLLAQAVRLAGAAKVIVVDHHDERLAVALQLKADIVLNPRKAALASVLTGNSIPDLVFEACGDATAFRDCLDVVKDGGRVGVIGYSGNQSVTIKPTIFMRKLLGVQGVLSPTGTWFEAIDLLSARKIEVEPLLTHRMPLERFADAFTLAASRTDGVIRVVLEP